MNIRFYNAKILLSGMEHTFQLIEGELWVKGNRIVYIGDGTDTSRIYEHGEPEGILWDRQIDLGKNLMMSGF